MVMNFLLLTSLLFFFSCDDYLGSLPSLDYYCPVEDFEVNLYDCNSYDISWKYDIASNDIQTLKSWQESPFKWENKSF